MRYVNSAASFFRRHGAELAWAAGLGTAGVTIAVALATVPTTINDFKGPGTQPETLTQQLRSGNQICVLCHGAYSESHEPYQLWAASMMGQASRDPLFLACLAIANQDAAFSGDLCLRCHSPMGWLEGRSEPTDGSALKGQDLEGVSCSICHRMVDPVYHPGMSPPEDQAILANLQSQGNLPVNPHTAYMVIDPEDRRRGPYELTPETTYHQWLLSPFHRDSSMCATCHDVSNPAYTAVGVNQYVLNALDTPHPTGNKYDMFPAERTYSEWLKSDFAEGPIDMGGRFGGNNPLVGTCQDCHMPEVTGTGCAPEMGAPLRKDMGAHYFNGGNYWVLSAIRNLYQDSDTGLTDQSVIDSQNRAVAMLQAAADLELSVYGTTLRARVVNQSGHKLPTGYPEGRRMWVNVQFRDAKGEIISENGWYEAKEAELDPNTIKVYEGKQGLDAAVAKATGLPEGEGFHFALNNVWIKDNRIPPRGFTNSEFVSIQAQPIGATYADGQYWDDTHYSIPLGATSATVNVYYQNTTKEYIEFLRDENKTNDAGQVVYNQWVALGKAAPVLMTYGVIESLPCRPDYDGDGFLTGIDFDLYVQAFEAGDLSADYDADGFVTGIDFDLCVQDFEAGC